MGGCDHRTHIDGREQWHQPGSRLGHIRLEFDPGKESTVVEELVDVINQYRKILDQLDIEFPENFILQDVLDAKENPNAVATQPEPQNSDVTGPSAESDRGKKKPTPKAEEPPAPQP